jgi:hypothetical protein
VSHQSNTVCVFHAPPQHIQQQGKQGRLIHRRHEAGPWVEDLVGPDGARPLASALRLLAVPQAELHAMPDHRVKDDRACGAA